MNNGTTQHHGALLQKIARRAMIERGLLPDFTPDALAELGAITGPSTDSQASTRDLRDLLWCSMDNDSSRDLDQLTVAEAIPGGSTLLRVAIADVDAVVKKGTAIDAHAKHNTTSVYTAAQIFPMLPEKLSTDITSLNYDSDRLAVVIEMVMGDDGSIRNSDIYLAFVRNKAKLAYNSVAEWLENGGAIPEGISAVRGLDDNLRLQDKVAQTMKALRHELGALNLETVETRPVFEADKVKDLEAQKKNRAKDIIEDLMIAANGVTARYLDGKGFPSLRRVVHTPKRWDRIVEVASEHGEKLPQVPDSKALEQFLLKQKAADPVDFPDLSLSIIKLMGPGEYTAELPGEMQDGHFGLAVKDYTHSTAPNRRYPDLITHRLIKAALSGAAVPYGIDELKALALHCTQEEDAANKVERQVAKSAAALLLEHRIGERFDGIVTGAAQKGTWVRVFHPPIEGRVVHGFEGLDVGNRVSVELINTDVERGFIDFKRVG
jgi:exoribonuclease-2